MQIFFYHILEHRDWRNMWSIIHADSWAQQVCTLGVWPESSGVGRQSSDSGMILVTPTPDYTSAPARVGRFGE